MCNWGKFHYVCLEGCPTGNNQTPFDEAVCICYLCRDAHKAAEQAGHVLQDRPTGHPYMHTFACKPDRPEDDIDTKLDKLWEKFCPDCMEELDVVVERAMKDVVKMNKKQEKEEGKKWEEEEMWDEKAKEACEEYIASFKAVVEEEQEQQEELLQEDGDQQKKEDQQEEEVVVKKKAGGAKRGRPPNNAAQARKVISKRRR